MQLQTSNDFSAPLARSNSKYRHGSKVPESSLQFGASIARQQPDAPCTVVLANHEWRALHAHFRRSVQSPARVPTVAEAMLLIAQLGGFLARRGDGHPGATVI